MRARRDDPMDGQATVGAEDVQVVAKPRRRTYTAEYKRCILKGADTSGTPGAIGALLRREGLYSSPLVAWRRARGRGERAALAPKKRGQADAGRCARSAARRARAAVGRDDRAGGTGRSRGGRPKKLGGAARPAGSDRAVMIALVEERRAQVGVGPLCAALGLTTPSPTPRFPIPTVSFHLTTSPCVVPPGAQSQRRAWHSPYGAPTRAVKGGPDRDG